MMDLDSVEDKKKEDKQKGIKMQKKKGDMNKKKEDEEEKIIFSCPFKYCSTNNLYNRPSLLDHIRNVHIIRMISCLKKFKEDSVKFFELKEEMNLIINYVRDVKKNDLPEVDEFVDLKKFMEPFLK